VNIALPQAPLVALWWVPAGHLPSIAEAEERLEHQRLHGPTPFAFTFMARFSPGAELVLDDGVGSPA
jgi:hypothetical protein